MNKENGITLISLVITIIVLLILAGVTVATLIGDNGLIGKSGEAKRETEIAEEKEILETAVIQSMKNSKRGEINQIELRNILENKAEVIDNDINLVVKFLKSNRYYCVNTDGDISEYEYLKDETPGELAKNSDEEFMIESIEDLVTFSAMVNGGYSDSNITIGSKQNFDKVRLMTNLDFKSNLSYNNTNDTKYNGYLGIEDSSIGLKEALTNQNYKGFIPIGITTQKSFNGNFYGNNKSIKNIYINTTEYAGLFGCLNSKVDVSNLIISGNITSTGNDAGGLCAYWLYVNYQQTTLANLNNVINYCNITSNTGNAYNSAGGLIGVFTSNKTHTGINIVDCKNYGIIKTNQSNSGTGGILGKAQGDKINIINSGNYSLIDNIKGGFHGGAGGIIGTTAPSTGDTPIRKINIYNSFNKGNIEGNMCGGIIGNNDNKSNTDIVNCHNTGMVTGNIGVVYTNTSGEENMKLNNIYYVGSKIINKNTLTSINTHSITISNAKNNTEILNSLNTFKDEEDNWPERMENMEIWKRWITRILIK